MSACWRYVAPADTKVPKPEGEAYWGVMPFPPLDLKDLSVDSLGPCLRCGCLPSEHDPTKNAIPEFFKATENIEQFTADDLEAAYKWTQEHVPDFDWHGPLPIAYHGRVCCVCHSHAPTGVYLQFPKGRTPIAFDGDINQCICMTCVRLIVEAQKEKR